MERDVKSPIHPSTILCGKKTAVEGGNDHKGEVDDVEGEPTEDVDNDHDDQNCSAVSHPVLTLARDIVRGHPDDRLGDYCVQDD